MAENVNEKLFSEFAPNTTQEWKDKVIADLKGADFDKKLVWRTNEGFNVQPMYRLEDMKDLKHPVYGFVGMLQECIDYALIEKLNCEDGITVIMISHDIAAAVQYASHILHIGDTVFFGTKADYLESPQGRLFAAKKGGDAQ